MLHHPLLMEVTAGGLSMAAQLRGSVAFDGAVLLSLLMCAYWILFDFGRSTSLWLAWGLSQSVFAAGSAVMWVAHHVHWLAAANTRQTSLVWCFACFILTLVCLLPTRCMWRTTAAATCGTLAASATLSVFDRMAIASIAFVATIAVLQHAAAAFGGSCHRRSRAHGTTM